MCMSWLSKACRSRSTVLGLSLALCLIHGWAFGAVAATDLAQIAKLLPLVASNSGGGGLAAGVSGGGTAAVVLSYSVSGQIRTPSNAAIDNATLSGLPNNPATGQDGRYSALVAGGWSGSVTPTKTGWSFTPMSRIYSPVWSDKTGQDYVAEGVGYGVFRVSANQTANPGNGESWNTAFDTIQKGVDAAFAAGGGSVWVAAGTYVSTTDPVVVLREYVSVYGGFAGNENVLEARNPAAHPTIIDGENVRRGVLGSNLAAMDGFTITRGYAESGGGMFNEGTDLSVRNCTFTHNNAAPAPSVIKALPLALGESSGAGGGGAAAGGGGGAAEKTLAYTTGAGGAMFNSGSHPTVSDCVFSQNSAAEGGGGMYNYDATPYIVNCVFTLNTAANNTDAGTLADSLPLVAGNGGGGGGGGGGSAVGGAGGGTTQAVPAYTVGGAIRNDASSPSLMNCTFSGNYALDGAAIYNNASTPSIINTILWGDSPNEISGDASSVSTVGYSDVQGGYAGTANIDSDPFFVGPLYDLRLLTGSPCIDTGTSNKAPVVDISGAPRPQGNGFDRGAFER